MSWIRTAVSKAVEVGGRNNLTRTVRSYADSVVQTAGNAVAESAKIIQDRFGARNLRNFRQTVKRLEEVSVSCRGTERVQLLRRWLVSLKEVERFSGAYFDNDENKSEGQNNSDETKDSPMRPTLVYYVDPEFGGEPMNFRDVFLHSQALEGITLSMILEAPNEEEVLLLLQIYGLCLAGQKEVHHAVMSSIQDLALAFSNYRDEVLIKREELLQYAQGAIVGLKLNAEIPRIDAEVCRLMEKIDKIKPTELPLTENLDRSSEERTTATVEGLKEALGQIQLCSRLEELLLKKKSLGNGDPPELHTEKVHKLKILSESLVGSTSKAEQRISDHRAQKEEALNFRLAKAGEIGQLEKELTVEIRELENRKDELEAELKKVKTSLTTARARLRNAREEREQFDEASNQILVHLKSKEDELSRSVSSCRAEADVVNTWINFLEDAWVLQSKYKEQKEKQVKDHLEKYGDHFVTLVIHLLSAYKEQLALSVASVKKLANKLHPNEGSEAASRIDKDSPKAIIRRKTLEEEYLDLEAKFVTILSIVDTMKKQFYSQEDGIYRKDNERVKELFDAIDNLKSEFDSIERPILEVETSTPGPNSPSNKESNKTQSLTSRQVSETSDKKQEKKESSSIEGDKIRDAIAQLELDSELEKDGRDDTADEISNWECDVLEKDLKTGS